LGVMLVVDRRVLRILALRALTLSFTLIIVVLITSIILTGTGYDTVILNSIIQTEIQALSQELRARNPPPPPEEVERVLKERREELIRLYGLDKPVYYRVLDNFLRTLTLNLEAISDDVAQVAGVRPPLPVGHAIAIVLPRTIIMITIAYIISSVIAILLGPFIAYRRGSLLDKGIITYAAFTNALPIWWIAMISIFVFGFYLRVAPSSYREVIKYVSSLGDSLTILLRGDLSAFSSILVNLRDLIYYSYLPITVVTFATLGGLIYSARAVAIRVVTEDYVVAARAKGLPERAVLRRYIIRVIAGPILTFVILGLAFSIGGFIITESVFDWPGMGFLFYAAISVGDSPTVLGLVYVTTLVYVIARFVLEVIYVILDPRVRL